MPVRLSHPLEADEFGKRSRHRAHTFRQPEGAAEEDEKKVAGTSPRRFDSQEHRHFSTGSFRQISSSLLRQRFPPSN
ncbi:hypothetical protein F2P81_010133 [Scophthalmus maximus]|uniref:Uncharacterized protein n=1 Tax=Scophthalmus maximus TaxID=52904 RepID=A0A6A4SX18_SCOMX|nr:hypothetical protein F2P81_010133 [Scophthalmus maximus]